MEEVMRFTILILVIVLSGHTVMVGNLGRTELATSAEEDAREFFRSAQALKALPHHIEVLPGAYSGSICRHSLSGKPSSTIGFEKRNNRTRRIGDEEESGRCWPTSHLRRPQLRGPGRSTPATQPRPDCGGRKTVRHVLPRGRSPWTEGELAAVLVNAFVGGMVGIGRTVIALIGSEAFGVSRRRSSFPAAPARSASTAFGAISAMRSGRYTQVSSPTASASHGRSVRSPR